jgi:hypothetical protein
MTIKHHYDQEPAITPAIDDSWKGAIVTDVHREVYRFPFDLFGEGVHWECVPGILRASKKVNGETFADDMTHRDFDNAFSVLQENFLHGIPLCDGARAFLEHFLIAHPGNAYASFARELLRSVPQKEGESADYSPKELSLLGVVMKNCALPECGKTFPTLTPVKKYCSDACANVAHQRTHRRKPDVTG